MHKKIKVLVFFLFGIAIITISGTYWVESKATTQNNKPPPRQMEILVPFKEYQWWLLRWDTNEIVCTVMVEHEDIPTAAEVKNSCEEDAYEAWLVSAPCQEAAEGGAITQCPGLYLYYVTTRPNERTVLVNLPLPLVKLSMRGCDPTPQKNQCDQLPSLVFFGEEPLPNEQITSLHIRIENNFFDCPGSACQIMMKPTGLKGVDVEFWANSSFGDETKHYKARVRIVDGGVSTEPGKKNWIVDVISSQWQGTITESCAATWEAFPTLGDPPQWLSSPQEASNLASDTPFVFLAGQLIAWEAVDASECPQGGLLSNGAATVCGLERARSVVNDWQDQFDQKIIDVANIRKIPAQLLKNIFAQESQFWPGEIIHNEFGLGQMTDQGADAPLLWNPAFYNQFCPLVLHEAICAKGYAQLDAASQAMLRGAAASRTNASCPNCEFGVDLAHAEFTVDLFAQTLIGNCEQVAYIMYNLSGKSPGAVSTYEDLWRYTLVNYNAGPGCLITALNTAKTREGISKINWQTVSTYMSESCQNAITYVERVTRDRANKIPDFVATPTQIVIPGERGSDAGTTPLPTIAATISTPTPTPTPPNVGGYPPPAATLTPIPTVVGYPPPPSPTSTQSGYP